MATVEAPRKLRRRTLRPGTADHFFDWAERYVVLDNGEPWRLEPFQRAFVRDFFRGFDEAWFVVPEGNGKTTLIAGLAIYHCLHVQRSYVSIAASSREQAQWAFLQAEGMVRGSAKLRELLRLNPGRRTIRTYADMPSTVQVHAADDRTGDGIIPTLCLLDELHRHRDLKLYRTWRGKIEKRGAQLVAISTAGEPMGEFESTREKIRQEAEKVTRRGSFLRAESKQLVLHEWAVPEDADVSDMRVVKAANPFSAVTVAGLRHKYGTPTMTEQHWRRFVCNLPTRSDRSAITEAEWAAAETDDAVPEGESVWVGIDVAWKWDTTALVPLWWASDDERIFGLSRVLVPPRDGSSLDHRLIERALIEMHGRNPIERVVMDEHRAEQLASWIEEELGVPVVVWTSSNGEQAKDFEAFMEGLRLGRIRVQRDDKDLRHHAMNAVARLLPAGNTMFDRPAGHSRVAVDQDVRVIDALVAAAMVHRTRLQNPARRASAYSGERGLAVA